MFDAIKIGKEKKVKHVLSDNGWNFQSVRYSSITQSKKG